jgi:hypothetical protein
VNASLISGLSLPDGIAVAVPEPSTLMLLLAGWGGPQDVAVALGDRTGQHGPMSNTILLALAN